MTKMHLVKHVGGTQVTNDTDYRLRSLLNYIMHKGSLISSRHTG